MVQIVVHGIGSRVITFDRHVIALQKIIQYV